MRVGRWLLIGLLALAPTARAQNIGTDFAGLNPCLYGDCEARGAYAADPFGWANPGTLPVLALAYVPRGVLVSPSYFRLNAGGVGIDIESGSATVIADPWLLQVNAVYAEAKGTVRSLPGVALSSRTRIVRLAAAVDLGRTALGLTGFSIGLLAGVPGTHSDLRLTAGGTTIADSRDDHELALTPGAHWRGGQHDWFGVGAFVNATQDRSTVDSMDPITGAPVRRRGTSNAWFARAGVSLLPFIPVAVADRESLAGEFLSELRIAADVEHQNIAVPGEGSRRRQTGYFGVDAPTLPDAWNPLSDYLHVYLIGGVDTAGGWGVGAGLWGNGVLQFVSCNPAYSSRPLAQSLGSRVNTWSATCSVVAPF